MTRSALTGARPRKSTASSGSSSTANGCWRVRRDVLLRRPVHRGGLGPRADRGCGGRRPGRPRSATGVRRGRLAANVGGRASGADTTARAADRGQRRAAHVPPDPRERQARLRDAARRERPRGGLPLLRRPRRDAARHERPGQRTELRRLHDSGADRRRRGDHTLEHPARTARLEALPRARGRQHRRREAVGGDADVDAHARGADRRSRLPGRRRERRHRLR